MRLERNLLDKWVSGGFLNKRQIGRPLKYNLRTKDKLGWLELIFYPRNKWEMLVSKTVRAINPYLAFFTYRFHVEKAREAGIRIEDFYYQKFHKEPYIFHHIYAQHFHPETLLERIRDVHFYRRPRTLFKGFRVPDWATAEQKHGWEMDLHSRTAWKNALHDFRSEWTPTQFVGDRLEPNIIQWFRLEHFGKGKGAKLFYNEVPNPTWLRHKGHLDEPEKYIYSFTWGNQDQPLMFGIDTATPEGREQFKKEYDAFCDMCPELLSKDDIVFPHELPPSISEEPHFQRVWMHYRLFVLNNKLHQLVESGNITHEDALAFGKFVDLKNHPAIQKMIFSQQGSLPHLENDPNFLASKKVIDQLGFTDMEFSSKTSQPLEEQFWEQFDQMYGLNEKQMIEHLDFIVTDPENQSKLQALIDERQQLLGNRA